MQVNSVQPNYLSFNSLNNRKRILTPDMRENAAKILQYMNNNSTVQYNKNKTAFTTNYLANLTTADGSKFTDTRLYSPKDKNNNYIYDFSLIYGKSEFNINSKTGEIVVYKKSIFKTWGNIFAKTKYFLEQLINNFNNPDVVQKHYFGFSDFTEKGMQKLYDYRK